MDEGASEDYVAEISFVRRQRGAGGGNRTLKGLPPMVFETIAFAVSPPRRGAILPAIANLLKRTEPGKVWGRLAGHRC